MDRQVASPGPEIGWAFGGLGFVASIVAGRLLEAGVGFLLVALVFWTAVGSLFAFLVERSTIEEQDRADELLNTRLATLSPATGSPVDRVERPRPAPDAGASVPPAHAAPGDAQDRPSEGRVAGSAVPPAPRSAPRSARTPSGPPVPDVLASPRAYREAAADAAALRDGVARDRSLVTSGPPSASDRRPRADRTSAAGPGGRGEHPDRPDVPRPQPRSPREYREARAEAERRRHAAV